MMIETIAETYGRFGRTTDLSQLVTATVNTPEDRQMMSDEYIPAEFAIRDDFMRFISARAQVGQNAYQAAFGTQRWAVSALTPVSLAATADSGLQAIPFVERHIDHSYGMRMHKETATVRAIGFYVTAMSVSQTLRHHTVSRPYSRHHSKRNGVIRRLTPEHLMIRPDTPIMPQPGNQSKFGQFIAELAELE